MRAKTYRSIPGEQNAFSECVECECVFVCSCTFYFFALVYENLINRDDYLLQFSFTSLDKEKPPKSAKTVFCTVCDTITVLNTPTRALYEFCSVLSAAKLVPHNKRIQPAAFVWNHRSVLGSHYIFTWASEIIIYFDSFSPRNMNCGYGDVTLIYSEAFCAYSLVCVYFKVFTYAK